MPVVQWINHSIKHLKNVYCNTELPSTPVYLTLTMLFLAVLTNAYVSLFQNFLHSSSHFILFSTASFGHTLCFCPLTIPVGIT